MSGKVAEIRELLKPEGLADSVAQLWNDWHSQKRAKIDEWKELRNYVFATDTSGTTNSELPWRNKTTLPKLCQIRDNLHSNYMAALFPNDDWLKWEAYSSDEIDADKQEAIQAYMSNKVREAKTREVISQAVYDFIDYGNCFGDVEFIKEVHTDDASGEEITGFVGPRPVRISPLDICFNPLADSFHNSPKIVRSIKHMGELLVDIEENADGSYLEGKTAELQELRRRSGSYTEEDFNKAEGFQIDGFGNYHTYLQSSYVEILEFEGDAYDPDTGDLLKNHLITVADRRTVLRAVPIPSWQRKGTKAHAGWRKRPDNLWAMGPLDNLVGMQYRIDHLENLKADAWDMTVFPMPKITGEVEEFNFGPGEEIHVIDGDVEFMHPDPMFLQADSQIAILERKMEEFVGAPSEALGIRTPGEKTAFEVGQLASAASRIFQEKITSFETNYLEPLLNSMLEIARRSLDMEDVVRVYDDDIGAERFLSIRKEDITAKGKLRPIGARHFASQQKLAQDLNGLFNSGLTPLIVPHTSRKKLTKLVEDLFQLERFELFSDNAGVFEDAETQRLMNQVQEDMEVEQGIDTDAPEEEV